MKLIMPFLILITSVCIFAQTTTGIPPGPSFPTDINKSTPEELDVEISSILQKSNCVGKTKARDYANLLIIYYEMYWRQATHDLAQSTMKNPRLCQRSFHRTIDPTIKCFIEEIGTNKIFEIYKNQDMNQYLQKKYQLSSDEAQRIMNFFAIMVELMEQDE